MVVKQLLTKKHYDIAFLTEDSHVGLSKHWTKSCNHNVSLAAKNGRTVRHLLHFTPRFKNKYQIFPQCVTPSLLKQKLLLHCPMGI